MNRLISIYATNFPAIVTNTLKQLLNEMLNVLEKHKAPTDLSLMVLGNMVTNLINTSIATGQRQAIANSFARALQSSVNDDQAH